MTKMLRKIRVYLILFNFVGVGLVFSPSLWSETKNQVNAKRSPEELLQNYNYLFPFFKMIWQPELVEKCSTHSRRKICQIELEWKESPQPLYALLEETEKSMDMTDPKNLSSKLGQYYQELKKFMGIYERFRDCQASAQYGTGDYLEDFLWDFMGYPVEISAERECHSWRGGPDFVLNQNVGELISDISDMNLNKDKLPEVAQLEEKILIKQLKRGIEVISLLNGSAKTLDDICQNANCSQKERALLAGLHQEVRTGGRAKPPNTAALANEVNQMVAQANVILDEYTSAKEQYLKELSVLKNSPHYREKHARLQRRVGERLSKQIMDKKRNVFEQVYPVISRLESKVGKKLLLSSFLKKKTKIAKLEEVSPKFFGYFGLTPKSLEDTEPFVSLETVDSDDIKLAMADISKRVQGHIGDILQRLRERQKEDEDYHNAANLTKRFKFQKRRHYKTKRVEALKKLAKTDPAVLGRVLQENPESAGVLCTVAQSMGRDERSNKYGEKVLHGALALFAAASLWWGFGAGLPFFWQGTAISLTFFGIDLAYINLKLRKHQKHHQELLNVYLSEIGDEKNIEYIRNEWRELLEAEYRSQAIWGIGVANLSLLRFFGSGARVASYAAIGRRGIIIADPTLKQRKDLIFKLTVDGDERESVRNLIDYYGRERVANLLAFLAGVETDRQNKLIKFVAKTYSKNPFPPRGLNLMITSSEVEKFLSKEQWETLRVIVADKYDDPQAGNK